MNTQAQRPAVADRSAPGLRPGAARDSGRRAGRSRTRRRTPPRSTLVACGVSVAVLAAASLAATDDDEQPARGRGPQVYVMGTKTLAVPAIPRPERGKAVRDPVFSTPITRITDASDGWGEKMRRHSYPTFSPLNCDGSLIAVQEGRWHLYDARSCKHLGELKGPFGDSGAPRWDARDPQVFYFAAGTTFQRYDVRTGEATVLHDFKTDFPDMEWLFHPVYVEPSADARYFGFIVMAERRERGRQIAKITYDRVQDRIVGRLPGRANEQYGRYVSVSPSGKRVVVTEVVDDVRSTTSFALDFSNPVALQPRVGHMDLGIDTQGNEVLLFGNDATDFLSMQDLETGRETPLLSYVHGTTWAESRTLSGQGFHISGNAYATPGWMVVSTYGYEKQRTHWNSHAIYLLELNPDADAAQPVIWRVAHARSVWDPGLTKHYWAETHASIDPRGRTIIFASNWGDPKAAIETYRLDLPEDWYERLMGEQAAEDARARVAKLLGMTVRELTGR